MSRIVNHPSFIAAALARREEILAECEQARLAASARSQARQMQPLAVIRRYVGNALIQLGEFIRPAAIVAQSEQPNADSV